MSSQFSGRVANVNVDKNIGTDVVTNVLTLSRVFTCCFRVARKQIGVNCIDCIIHRIRIRIRLTIASWQGTFFCIVIMIRKLSILFQVAPLKSSLQRPQTARTATPEAKVEMAERPSTAKTAPKATADDSSGLCLFLVGLYSLIIIAPS